MNIYVIHNCKSFDSSFVSNFLRCRIIMVVPNDFLWNNMTVNNVHVANCFCSVCRQQKVDRLLGAGLTNLQLHDHCFVELVQQEDVRLARLFNTTMRRIVAGKAYCDQCLEGTGYTKFGWWARQSLQLRDLEPKIRKKFVKKVNEINLVFNSWDTIVKNLTDERMIYVDARRFSVTSFYLAIDLSWCLRQNELHRPAGRNEGDTIYTEDTYQDVLQYLYDSGILNQIDHNPVLGSIIGGRLQTDIIRRCRSRFNPY